MSFAGIGLGPPPDLRPTSARAPPDLRQAENDLNAALEALASPETNQALQLACLQRALALPHAPAAEAVAALEGMGFDAEAARRALAATHGDMAAAVAALTTATATGEPSSSAAAASSSSAAAPAEAPAAPAAPSPPPFNEEEMARIDESGLADAVKASEASYQAVSIELEAAAIKFYLAAVDSKLH